MRALRSALFTLACALPMVISASAGAWSNGGYSADPAQPDYGTHDWIADAALSIQTGNTSFLSSHHSRFILGTEAPDNPQYIGDTSEHHVYYRASGALQDDSAAIRARDVYTTALQYLRTGNLEEAAFSVGAMSHYVADMGVFGHTMGSNTDWGSESVHQDYEDAVDSETVARALPTNLPLGDKDAYNATIDLARETTFGSSTLKPNTWMDDNFDWSSVSYRAYASASVDEAVKLVAAAINHLVKEADLGSQQNDNTPEPDDNNPDREDSTVMMAGIVAAIIAVAAAAALIARRMSRR